jgi:hypothetical protein
MLPVERERERERRGSEKREGIEREFMVGKVTCHLEPSCRPERVKERLERSTLYISKKVDESPLRASVDAPLPRRQVEFTLQASLPWPEVVWCATSAEAGCDPHAW